MVGSYVPALPSRLGPNDLHVLIAHRQGVVRVYSWTVREHKEWIVSKGKRGRKPPKRV